MRTGSAMKNGFVLLLLYRNKGQLFNNVSSHVGYLPVPSWRVFPSVAARTKSSSVSLHNFSPFHRLNTHNDRVTDDIYSLLDTSYKQCIALHQRYEGRYLYLLLSPFFAIIIRRGLHYHSILPGTRDFSKKPLSAPILHGLTTKIGSHHHLVQLAGLSRFCCICLGFTLRIPMWWLWQIYIQCPTSLKKHRPE